MKEKITAIVLAAGQGRRMESRIQKQYLKLNGKPLIFYALDVFEHSEADEIILVVGKGEVEYCRKEIVETFGFRKVTQIVEGGEERYHSVYEGLKAAGDCTYVLIHDGARPLVTERMISDSIAGVRQYEACVIGMPVKDTIKLADQDGFASITPDRNLVWMIQTPQTFSYLLILGAYQKLLLGEISQSWITDDAMVVEKMTERKVKLLQGSYRNLKVTTPEDLAIAEAFLSEEKAEFSS